MEVPTDKMPLFSMREKPSHWLGTNNVIPMLAILLTLLGGFWNFSSAQTELKAEITATKKDSAKLEEAQKELRTIIKEDRAGVREELKAMNGKVDGVQQLLVQLQLLVVELRQQQKK